MSSSLTASNKALEKIVARRGISLPAVLANEDDANQGGRRRTSANSCQQPESVDEIVAHPAPMPVYNENRSGRTEMNAKTIESGPEGVSSKWGGGGGGGGVDKASRDCGPCPARRVRWPAPGSAPEFLVGRGPLDSHCATNRAPWMHELRRAKAFRAEPEDRLEISSPFAAASSVFLTAERGGAAASAAYTPGRSPNRTRGRMG
jgi:hypothetical protein